MSSLFFMNKLWERDIYIVVLYVFLYLYIIWIQWIMIIVQ